ncbi:unnamed protein product [Notodromas monacha]|uniref:Uncharacterized protein n=1 Tax=Notodromas monacha TaxID=399045 RepID=A0A7R9BVE3_9CRUS|nr:unnamed protein product [Notodromas monacha]CAG0922092.1 unnamed protein product [Notodromas monacha]
MGTSQSNRRKPALYDDTYYGKLELIHSTDGSCCGTSATPEPLFGTDRVLMAPRWLWFLKRSSVPSDADVLRNSWSTDDVNLPDDADSVEFSPRLSLVTSQDEEPTWCQPVAGASPPAVNAGRRSRHQRDDVLQTSIAVIGEEIRNSDDSGLPDCGEDLHGSFDEESANQSWSSKKHCHFGGETLDDAKRAQNQLLWACLLCLIFMLGEGVGGYLSNSLAVMTDAAHLMSDFASFLISLFAIWLGKQKPSRRMSFGYYRAEALGALTSIIIIWIVSGVLVYLAVLRLMRGSYTLKADTMIIVAAIGVLINIVTTNINVRAAFIHVVGDLVQSVGVLIAAFIIHYKPEWKVADPICTFLFSGLVILTTIGVLKDTLMVLMESTPKQDLDDEELRRHLTSVENVKGIHDFHVWSLTVGKHALAVHVAIDESADQEVVLRKLTHKIRVMHPSIISSTIQVERGCRSSCDGCLPAY